MDDQKITHGTTPVLLCLAFIPGTRRFWYLLLSHPPWSAAPDDT